MICFWGLADIGKTSAIRHLWNKLAPTATPLYTSGDDICVIADMNGSRVGLESQGDPSSEQDFWLDELIEAECDVIVCASRTKGATVKHVEDKAAEHGYTLVWLSPFSSPEKVVHSRLNEITAEMIIRLINEMLVF